MGWSPGVPQGQPWIQGPGTQTEASSCIFLTTRSQCYLKNERFAFQHPAAGSSQETNDGTSDGYKHKFLGTSCVNRWTSKKRGLGLFKSSPSWQNKNQNPLQNWKQHPAFQSRTFQAALEKSFSWMWFYLKSAKSGVVQVLSWAHPPSSRALSGRRSPTLPVPRPQLQVNTSGSSFLLSPI